MIQSYIKEKYNLKMHTAYIAEVKRNSGMKMQMEVKSEGTSQDRKSHPSKEKVEIIKELRNKFMEEIDDKKGNFLTKYMRIVLNYIIYLNRK